MWPSACRMAFLHGWGEITIGLFIDWEPDNDSEQQAYDLGKAEAAP